MVGSSSSECDTIPGRQCMASSLFLEGRYDEVSLYLSSIKSYFSNDDSFNFNFAQVILLMYIFIIIPLNIFKIIKKKKNLTGKTSVG